jgi:hypothetical protein
MVLKNNKPSFYSVTPVKSVANASTQAGQETMTLELAIVTAAAKGAM